MVAIENKVQRYESYKDSGVEWLGKIPEHWELTRLGTRFKERKDKVSDKDFPPLSVTKNGTVPQLANAAKSKDGDNRKLVKEGDFVINSRSDRKGSSGIAYQDGSVSLIYIVLEPLNIHPLYCNYLLKSYNFIEEFYRMGHGIVADLWTTRYDEMRAITIGTPPLPEQTAIAQFLDDKTIKIDDAIAIKEQQINLLKERKQILIHKAVTRGLDDSVTLKDSGVEWIGEIPEGWEVKKVTHLFDSIGSGTTPTSGNTIYYDGKYNFLQTGDLNDGKIKHTKRTLKERAFKDFSSLKIYPIGSLVMAMYGATIGKLGILELESATNQACCVFRKSHKINTEYFFQVLLAFRTEIISFGYGGGQPNISQDLIKSLRFPIAPLSEQKEISAYIETASQKIETAIALKQQEIEKLKEYKGSLINGVVTGKVRVC